jgi:hypothetical protein
MSTPETGQTLSAIAEQLWNGDEVVVEGKKLRVKRIGSGRLRMVQFQWNGRLLEAIEQNPDKPSRWGRLARENHRVVQFIDVESHKYLAVSVDGKIKEYGR